MEEASGSFDSRRDTRTGNGARLRSAQAGFFMSEYSQDRRETTVANHLTPEELSKELGIERNDVIQFCYDEGVPIYQGKIDKTLFQAQFEVTNGATQPAAG
ncbi:MAG: hypothetical protein H0W87_01845 [Actinobacteria bacterium]|nr:hypothetical protein [Actinomycetota bacterium]